ncbi:hypothetical protein Asulf_00044 [Archaeoglobus sulfaticallidus PM70-1]|uniref:Uncharacterized protein n=1 Tax=Archaeoglobus sulfaticallidus PM70-1 TaxID=387631 RepID=N0BIW3_9EURY|nr:hypothetical protein [Archaeoglobus sulfaticallidus]AGK60080.1 hypothetical protein Asulf_00044 [Archaeoglobus sulfaticallidus PM70-1]
MKVIQIMGYSLSKLALNIDVTSFEDEWHIVTAKQIIRQTKKYEIECWQPERTFKKVQVCQKNGIVHKVFPSFYIPFRGLKEFEISLPLLKEIKNKRSFDPSTQSFSLYV